MSSTRTIPQLGYPVTQIPCSGCIDDKYLESFFERGMLYLMRGFAVAMMMPVEILAYLRRGHRIKRNMWQSWLCSAAMYVGFVGIWILLSQAALNGRSRTEEVFYLCLTIVALAIINGRLQGHSLKDVVPMQNKESRMNMGHHHSHGPHGHGYGPKHGKGHGHHHHGHGFGHGHGPKHDQYRSQASEPAQQSSEAERSTQPKATEQTSVCMRDCRSCPESTCLKTGQPRRQASR